MNQYNHRVHSFTFFFVVFIRKTKRSKKHTKICDGMTNSKNNNNKISFENIFHDILFNLKYVIIAYYG